MREGRHSATTRTKADTEYNTLLTIYRQSHRKRTAADRFRTPRILQQGGLGVLVSEPTALKLRQRQGRDKAETRQIHICLGSTTYYRQSDTGERYRKTEETAGISNMKFRKLISLPTWQVLRSKLAALCSSQ